MKFDIAIVGGSLAGASAAYILGSAGLKVALFDKASFPRRKPCGEGLSLAGLAALKAAGLWGDDQLIPYLPYSGYHLHSGSKSRVISFSGSGGITVRREELDSMVFYKAGTIPSVTLFPGRKVNSISCEGSIRVGSDTYTAKHIILADGGARGLAESLSTKSRSHIPERIGVSAGFIGSYALTPQHVNIQIKDGYEIYATPLAEGRLNLSVLSRYPSTKNPRNLLLDPAFQHAIFRKLYFSGELETPALGCPPFAPGFKGDHKGAVILIGDACEKFDPIGGMGMTHAVISAQLAAEAVLKIESGASSRQAAMAAYSKQRNKAARPLRQFTALTGGGLRLAGRFPSLLDIAASPWGIALTKNFYPIGEAA